MYLIGKTNRLGMFSEVVVLAGHMQLISRAHRAVLNTLQSHSPPIKSGRHQSLTSLCNLKFPEHSLIHVPHITTDLMTVPFPLHKENREIIPVMSFS